MSHQKSLFALFCFCPDFQHTREVCSCQIWDAVELKSKLFFSAETLVVYYFANVSQYNNFFLNSLNKLKHHDGPHKFKDFGFVILAMWRVQSIICWIKCEEPFGIAWSKGEVALGLRWHPCLFYLRDLRLISTSKQTKLMTSIFPHVG